MQNVFVEIQKAVVKVRALVCVECLHKNRETCKTCPVTELSELVKGTGAERKVVFLRGCVYIGLNKEELFFEKGEYATISGVMTNALLCRTDDPSRIAFALPFPDQYATWREN